MPNKFLELQGKEFGTQFMLAGARVKLTLRQSSKMDLQKQFITLSITYIYGILTDHLGVV